MHGPVLQTSDKGSWLPKEDSQVTYNMDYYMTPITLFWKDGLQEWTEVCNSEFVWRLDRQLQ